MIHFQLNLLLERRRKVSNFPVASKKPCRRHGIAVIVPGYISVTLGKAWTAIGHRVTFSSRDPQFTVLNALTGIAKASSIGMVQSMRLFVIKTPLRGLWRKPSYPSASRRRRMNPCAKYLPKQSPRAGLPPRSAHCGNRSGFQRGLPETPERQSL